MTKSGPKNQFCKNYQIILLCTYFGYLISSEDLSNISENIYISRFLWDATANAKIHCRYFISKIFFDLSLILKIISEGYLKNFCLKIPGECYRKRYGIRHRLVEKI